MTLNRTLDEVLPLDTADVIERTMASQTPFGDYSYILNQMQHCLSRRLERLAPDVPSAAELLDAVACSSIGDLHRLFAEPTLRSAIVHAHEQVVSGTPYGLDSNDCGLRLIDCLEMFTAAARYLREGGADTPLQDGSLIALGPEPHLGWIWQDEHPNDTFGSAFRKLVMSRYGALPSSPSNTGIEELMRGARLLEELLPSLAPSALHHAQIIAVVPSAGTFTDIASSSQFQLAGVIFLGEKLGSPWWVAEHLLHESLHQKLYDFRHGHLLMQLDDAIDEERPVVTPWNPSRLSGANRWSVWRVVAAFHVYVQLALLTTVAEQRAPELEDTFGPLSGMLESHRARARARYLGQQLEALCWGKLGPAGHALADWLHSLLNILDPAPAPPGATVHLYLDLYRKEALQLESTLSRSPDRRSALRHNLAALARQDVADARAILRDLDAHSELEQLDTSVARFTEEELAESYPQIRRTVEACLIDASLDGYRLSESGQLDTQVREMVSRASDLLFALSARIPVAVAQAKRRAVEHQFPMSCDDGVGQFLAAMVAHLPPAAKVLEVGTGVGVGTAWITTGLGARTDVDVLSVEVDERLSAAARTYHWPSCVRLETAEGEAVLGAATFNLIFADASPFKFHHVGAMVDALRPGGMLIFDDMAVSAKASEPTQTLMSTLREELLDHPGLVALDIQWSSGLMLATKRL